MLIETLSKIGGKKEKRAVKKFWRCNWKIIDNLFSYREMCKENILEKFTEKTIKNTKIYFLEGKFVSSNATLFEQMVRDGWRCYDFNPQKKYLPAIKSWNII